MKNRFLKDRRRREEGGISMFPFLAVLICTMGALILLLVIISHEAAARAEREAAEAASQRKVDLVEQREDSVWRTEILKNSLNKTREKLADLRHRLGYLENDTSRLRGEVIGLAKTLKKLEKQKPTPKNAKLLEEQLARLRSKIATARRKVDETMEKAIGKNRSYAVVPYHGPNETRRHPIYIECRADGVFLQPEGLRLEDSDFVGFFGPDNPLAAALRAKAGYLHQKYQFSKEVGRPYPLILVRQSGIESYCAAMDAMRSWDSEFGYELVEDDMPLDFNKPNIRLKQVMQREIEYARSKKQALRRAVPRLYNDPIFRHSGHGGRQLYAVSSSQGGIVPYRGDVEDLELAHSRHSASRYPRYTGNRYPGNTGTPNHPAGNPSNHLSGNPASNPSDNRSNDLSKQGPYGGNGLGTGSTPGNGNGGETRAYPRVTKNDSPSNLHGPGYDPSGRNGYRGSPLQNSNPTGIGQGSPFNGSTSASASGQGSVAGMRGSQGGIQGYTPRGTQGNTQGPTPQLLDPPGGINGTGGNNGIRGANATGNYVTPNAPETPRLLQPPGVRGNGYHNQDYNNSSGQSSDRNAPGQPSPNNMMPQPSGDRQGDPHGQGTSSDGSSQGSLPEAPMPGTTRQGYPYLSPATPGNAGGTANGSGGSPCNSGACSMGSPPSPLSTDNPSRVSLGTPGGSNSSMAGQTAQAPIGIGEWQPNSGNPGGKPVAMEPREPDPFAPAHRHRRQPSKPKSIAEDRGKNWCLPKESAYRVPLSRPISIECYTDRLILRPTRQGIPGKTIQLKGQTRGSVNEFVSAVWDRVESWGMAGQEMYWRPILSVWVHPGGESRFSDLQMLFNDSGFVVEKKHVEKKQNRNASTGVSAPVR